MSPRREAGLSATAAALREYLRDHNRQVLVLVALGIFLAAGLWFIGYAVIYWLAMLSETARHGLEARPPKLLLPIFIYSASFLTLLTLLVRRFGPGEEARDEKPAWEIALDFLLAIPRVTLAIGENLSAWQTLSDTELEEAAAFLHRLRDEPQIPAQHLRVLIPDAESRRKILLALQLVNLIRTRRMDGVLWIRLTRAVREGRVLPSVAARLDEEPGDLLE